MRERERDRDRVTETYLMLRQTEVIRQDREREKIGDLN